MKYWGRSGAFWGGLWGMLFGAALFAIPSISPVLVADPLVAWIVGVLESAIVVGGLSTLGVEMYSIGTPKDSIVKYDLALKPNIFLVLGHGTADEVAKAKDIMQPTLPDAVGPSSAGRTARSRTRRGQCNMILR